MAKYLVKVPYVANHVFEVEAPDDMEAMRAATLVTHGETGENSEIIQAIEATGLEYDHVVDHNWWLVRKLGGEEPKKKKASSGKSKDKRVRKRR